MKIDKYYIAAGVALLVILIVVFTQRSDWKADRFILSADSKGNLTPVSESYFADEEQRQTTATQNALAPLQGIPEKVNKHETFIDRGYFAHIDRIFGHGEYGAGCYGRREGTLCLRGSQSDNCMDAISCPAGSVALRQDHSGRIGCRCVVLVGS
tara:strand:- start:1554 stop:2015 length:462 start_codon:yes stop_codon:yes gene_type:complete